MPAPEHLPLVTVQEIGIDFGRRPILRNVNFSLNPGEIVTLIGPNGSGKTTLVRIVLGLIRPGIGTVSRRTGIRIGYMPQKLTIDRVLPLSVERFLGINSHVGQKNIVSALDEVGASHVARQPIQAISGGELQRVLLARALLREPDLLVLDEPVQGVDVTGQHDLYDLIGRVRDRHQCGVLLVSHDLHLVMAATDTVICLNQHICCSGRPEAVVKDPAYIELFGPEAARKLAVYTHHHDHVHDVHGDVVTSTNDLASGDSHG